MRNFRTRAPRLFANLLGGLSAALISRHHLQATVLAAFYTDRSRYGTCWDTDSDHIVRGLATGHVSEGVGMQYLLEALIVCFWAYSGR